MCCTEAITRILVFVSNFLFLLVGGALLTVGILFAVNFSDITDGFPDDYEVLQYIPYISIVVGSIIFVIAFLGCCGTLRSNTCMLTTYASILIVIFIVQVALGVYGLIKIKDTDELGERVVTTLTNLFRNYEVNKEVVDAIQQSLQCCGVTNATWWTLNGLSTPSSCTSSSGTVFIQGCGSLLRDTITTSIRTIAIVAIAVSAIEILGAVLALALSNCIRSNQRRGAYY